ncbi:elongation factor G [Phosphitispora fastidiosa]|uniref:elongation factor G n=1 Tax=Phosphitispora fastidiosa TaxID=2837202 RepID=UPI001E62C273|nr:elongation factor G [Phosphitispora fastidiosa]MBU7005704.1 elongation factor G [Phosphitispora fastidiosa]
MKSYQTSQLRNIGIFAHGGAGKTSLVESMLFNTGAINRLGRVEDGTTTSDYHPEEIKKQVTIHTTLVPCEWNDAKLNLLDSPGFSDFIGDVQGVLRVVDNTLFMVCAVAGVEVQTELIWDMASESGLPRVVFINKMDRENANFEKVLGEIEQQLPGSFIPVQIPIGAAETFSGYVDVIAQKAYAYKDKGEVSEIPVPDDLAAALEIYREKLVESSAEMDDEALEKYLNGDELSETEIMNGLKAGIKEGKVTPVLCGSATKNVGVKQLMDFMAEYYAAPEDKSSDPLSALVFKTLVDPFVGKMNFIRVFSGSLKADVPLYNATKEKAEKIGQVLYVRGKHQENTTQVPCGDIAVLVKLQDTNTNDSLGVKEKPAKLDPVIFPVPTFTVAIEPKSKGDEDKLGNAISRTLEEDPALRVEKNVETHQTLLTGMGEMHLDITLDKIKRKFGVDIVTKDVRVPYRETIRGTVKVEGKHKKQTGGHGQYGHCWLRIEPLAEGTFEFGEEIFGGSVPRQYIPAVEKGVREAMADGVLAGYPVTNVKVVVYDGSYHNVDSSEMAFKIAGAQAFKKGAQQAKPTLLEPIADVEVRVPENYTGDIISDFNTKRGRIQGMEPGEKLTTVKAQVPMSEMYRYAIDLKSMTQGRGSFSMEFSHYEEVPAMLADKIVEKAKAEKEAAEK